MKTHVCTLTERGQISIPADFRAELGLKPGDKLLWSASGDKALLVTTVEAPKRKGARAMIGWGRKFHAPRRTEDWMKELREGEQP